MGAQCGVLCLLFFWDIYMCKIEEGAVVPAKPVFYKRYVDESYIHRKKNINDKLFQNLNG